MALLSAWVLYIHVLNEMKTKRRNNSRHAITIINKYTLNIWNIQLKFNIQIIYMNVWNSRSECTYYIIQFMLFLFFKKIEREEEKENSLKWNEFDWNVWIYNQFKSLFFTLNP